MTYEVSPGCRSCGGTDRVEVLALGDMPLADGLVAEDQLDRPEARFPLTLLFCPRCSLVQIRETVAPGVLFGEDYPYYSSFSEGWLAHCRENARELIDARRLGKKSLVVELGSNDGYMLKNFKERDIPVLGIDPAPGPAAAAERAGIDVERAFFTRELAERLREDGQCADVVIANNVLAHTHDQPGFVAGIRALLKDEGMAVIEVPYVRDLMERCEFDTIYHEHHCYFSVTALGHLFAAHGLRLTGVKRLKTHGGSLRLYVQPEGTVAPGVARFLKEEHDLGLDAAAYYEDFAARVRGVRHELRGLLDSLKDEGARLAAYGAAAKGATLLNFAGVGREYLDYVVDRNRHKQGWRMPGVHLPIHDPARLLEDMPDYVLILAWNHKEEIVRQQEEYRRRGGRFIVPIPQATVLHDPRFDDRRSQAS